MCIFDLGVPSTEFHLNQIMYFWYFEPSYSVLPQEPFLLYLPPLYITYTVKSTKTFILTCNSLINKI